LVVNLYWSIKIEIRWSTTLEFAHQRQPVKKLKIILWEAAV